MIQLLKQCWSRFAPPPAASLPPAPAGRNPFIDVEGMIRQASTRVSAGLLLRKGKPYIHVLSRARMDELIQRAVGTLVEKHRAAGTLGRSASTARIEEDSAAEIAELVARFRPTADEVDDVAAVAPSPQAPAEEFEQLHIEPDPPASRPEPLRQAVREEPAAGPTAVEGTREIVILKKRLEKLLAHIAVMESALRTMSASKSVSNPQIQSLLRELGVAPEDRHFEKKKDMLKIILSTNQGIRHRSRELAARGITLEAPGEPAAVRL